MNSGDWLLLVAACVIVGFRTATFRRFVWTAPLHHGEGYFLGVEVPAGFYRASQGARWLESYRLLVTLEHALEAVVLVGILVFGYWSLVPVWAGGGAMLFTAVCLGFAVHARIALGANPPVRTRVAVPLEPRRLGDYFTWRAEALLFAVLFGGWALLLVRGDAQTRWIGPIVMTYVIAGLIPFKVGIVRNSIPIPAESVEKHLQWARARRVHALEVMDMMRWLLLACFGGYALVHGWPAMAASVWARWGVIATALFIGALMMRAIVKGQSELLEMGRGLRPAGSWTTPFRESSPGSSRSAAAFGAWFAGLVLLMVLLR